MQVFLILAEKNNRFFENKSLKISTLTKVYNYIDFIKNLIGLSCVRLVMYPFESVISTISVSYTHLDVYKRQGVHISILCIFYVECF